MVLLQLCCDQRIGEAKAGHGAILLKFEEKHQRLCPYGYKLEIHDNTKQKPRIGCGQSVTIR